MSASTKLYLLILSAALLVTACASSPQDEQRRLEREAAIDDVLSYKLDPAEYGDTKRCLSSMEFRSYRALDNRHLLFKGRGDRLWVNKLRARCPGLEPDSVLIVQRFGGNQFCSLDSFEATEWFGYAGRPGVRCILGDFQPVTHAQIDEIEKIIDAP
jgi:hypothetical protein